MPEMFSFIHSMQARSSASSLASLPGMTALVVGSDCRDPSRPALEYGGVAHRPGMVDPVSG
jgi:hypothetical protein